MTGPDHSSAETGVIVRAHRIAVTAECRNSPSTPPACAMQPRSTTSVPFGPLAPREPLFTAPARHDQVHVPGSPSSKKRPSRRCLSSPDFADISSSAFRSNPANNGTRLSNASRLLTAVSILSRRRPRRRFAKPWATAHIVTAGGVDEPQAEASRGASHRPQHPDIHDGADECRFPIQDGQQQRREGGRQQYRSPRLRSLGRAQAPRRQTQPPARSTELRTRGSRFSKVQTPVGTVVL